MQERLLVIKLGALGDFIYALGPMAAIRHRHPQAHITLLTTQPYAKLGHDCGYFDAVMIDTKPSWLDIKAWLDLRSQLNHGRFSRIYDLQNNDRTQFYLRLFSPRPEWVGAAAGASHRNTSPERVLGHAFYGHVQTLALAGINDVKLDALEWMKAQTELRDLKSPYILMVPGCSPKRPDKRWPAEFYRQVAQDFMQRGYQIVLLGTGAEAAQTAEIADHLDVLDLTDKTSLYDIAALARHAAGAVGNDTGPSHMIGLTGCPLVMLFCTKESTIKKHGPLGPLVTALEADDLATIAPNQVSEKLAALLRP